MNDKPYAEWTDAEKVAFQAHLADVSRRNCLRAREALLPWADYTCENFSHRQRFMLERVVTKAVEAADHDATRDLVIEVKVERTSSGRKGSPHGTFSVQVDVDLKGGRRAAVGWAHIGRRGALKGGITSLTLGGHTTKLGR